MGIHAGRIGTCKRLQDLLHFLRQRGPMGASGADIYEYCGMLNPGTEVSALRANGFVIDCKPNRPSPGKRKVWYYYFIEQGQRVLFALLLMIVPWSLFA